MTTVIHKFTLPKRLVGISNEPLKTVTALGFKELTIEDELLAVQRAHGNTLRLASALSQLSLVALYRGDRKEDLSLVDDTSEVAWRAMHPKVRSLCLSAYASLHQPDDEDTKGFLASQESSVG